MAAESVGDAAGALSDMLARSTFKIVRDLKPAEVASGGEASSGFKVG
jgi:hypothetical protein